MHICWPVKEPNGLVSRIIFCCFMIMSQKPYSWRAVVLFPQHQCRLRACSAESFSRGHELYLPPGILRVYISTIPYVAISGMLPRPVSHVVYIHTGAEVPRGYGVAGGICFIRRISFSSCSTHKIATAVVFPPLAVYRYRQVSASSSVRFLRDVPFPHLLGFESMGPAP